MFWQSWYHLGKSASCMPYMTKWISLSDLPPQKTPGVKLSRQNKPKYPRKISRRKTPCKSFQNFLDSISRKNLTQTHIFTHFAKPSFACVEFCVTQNFAFNALLSHFLHAWNFALTQFFALTHLLSHLLREVVRDAYFHALLSHCFNFFENSDQNHVFMVHSAYSKKQIGNRLRIKKKYCPLRKSGRL